MQGFLGTAEVKWQRDSVARIGRNASGRPPQALASRRRVRNWLGGIPTSRRNALVKLVTEVNPIERAIDLTLSSVASLRLASSIRRCDTNSPIEQPPLVREPR